MEGLAVMGFVLGGIGVVALVRLEKINLQKLIILLKKKGILEEDYNFKIKETKQIYSITVE